jgi:hypothetical protein
MDGRIALMGETVNAYTRTFESDNLMGGKDRLVNSGIVGE